VQQQFFPTSTRTELFSRCACPRHRHRRDRGGGQEAEKLVGDDPDISFFTTTSARAHAVLAGPQPVLPNANFAQIVIVTKTWMPASA